jgi:hypothetical protein
MKALSSLSPCRRQSKESWYNRLQVRLQRSPPIKPMQPMEHKHDMQNSDDQGSPVAGVEEKRDVSMLLEIDARPLPELMLPEPSEHRRPASFSGLLAHAKYTGTKFNRKPAPEPQARTQLLLSRSESTPIEYSKYRALLDEGRKQGAYSPDMTTMMSSYAEGEEETPKKNKKKRSRSVVK